MDQIYILFYLSIGCVILRYPFLFLLIITIIRGALKKIFLKVNTLAEPPPLPVVSKSYGCSCCLRITFLLQRLGVSALVLYSGERFEWKFYRKEKERTNKVPIQQKLESQTNHFSNLLRTFIVKVLHLSFTFLKLIIFKYHNI